MYRFVFIASEFRRRFLEIHPQRLTLSQLNPVHTLKFPFPPTDVNIILPSSPT